jgi:hypothetical protein
VVSFQGAHLLKSGMAFRVSKVLGEVNLSSGVVTLDLDFIKIIAHRCSKNSFELRLMGGDLSFRREATLSRQIQTIRTPFNFAYCLTTQDDEGLKNSKP